jgi:pyruvate dehydrogenase E2 component (dihydrolipoamide acetyltransferase)
VSELVMPRLSDTMEEGTVLRWLKRDGEHVSRGEELVEIETDKAAMTYESDLEGILQTIASEGDTLAVGELIAWIGEDRVKASPLARRIARETGVDLRGLTGSGPGGRIVKADVQAADATTTRSIRSESPPTSPVAGEGSAAHSVVGGVPATHSLAGDVTDSRAGDITDSQAGDVTVAKGETTSVELSRTQRTIARRMAESKATIPDFTLTTDIDMEQCVKLRAELKRLSQVDAPTYNDMIVKACALALRDHPRANGSYRDGRFELHARVNVGVAVAVAAEDSTAGALVVPTVSDADTKALGEIARETRALAQRVRDASITPPELSGGTFTVSNLGMYGIRSFTAIVNPPQAAILAVGEVAPRAVVRKKKIVARQTMSVTLACDHRILYGADAALFLSRIRELLEEPAALTL